MFLHKPNAYTGWCSILRKLLKLGKVASPRTLETREILGLSLRVDSSLNNIIYHPLRGLNYKFMLAEWLWIMAGSDSVGMIGQYNSVMRNFSDDGLTLAGAYGPRLVPQLPWVLEKLKEPETRQAVVSIWTPTPLASKDVPCTISLQFLLRGYHLNLIVSMRSSDAWLGFPYDFYVFTQIQNCLCGLLKVGQGWAQFNFGSSHLYHNNQNQASQVLSNDKAGRSFKSRELPNFPPDELFKLLKNPANQAVIEPPWVQYALTLVQRKEDALAAISR